MMDGLSAAIRDWSTSLNHFWMRITTLHQTEHMHSHMFGQNVLLLGL